MKRLALIFSALLVVLTPSAQAGVFNIPSFVPPGGFAIGFESELVLTGRPETSGAGIGAALKYTHGLNDLMNAQAIIGTGSEPRKFRAGGNLSFDFFPDAGKQPGIGIATQAVYYRLALTHGVEVGQLEVTLIPYLHKGFDYQGREIDPFVALPFGGAFRSGTYSALSNLVVGSSFKLSDVVKATVELGININRSQTYFSGGVTYFH